MMRNSELHIRRQALLARCEAQRAELSWRLAHILPKPLRGMASGQGPGASAARHPFAWLLALGGLLVFGRAREVLTALVWARSALGLLSRGAKLVGLVSALRARGAGRRRGKSLISALRRS